MATEEDLKKAEPEEDSSSQEEEEGEARAVAEPGAEARPEGAEDAAKKEDEEEEDEESNVPIQLGYQRYVYGAYMAGALLTAFLLTKIGHVAWYRIGQWKPEVGEPKDEILTIVSGVIGTAIALYYFRKPDARQYADEVAEELSKVTWPSRKEVTNSTTVVVLTTVFATVFFALMDRFWGFVTDKIYTF